MTLNESIVEDTALTWFGKLGYAVGHGPQLAPGEPAAERDSFGEVVLVGRLRRDVPCPRYLFHLPGEAIPTPDDVFGSPARISAVSSPNLEPGSPNLASSSPNLAGNRNADGCLIADQLPLPVIDDLSQLSGSLRASLEVIASEPRSKGKVDREVMTTVVLALCEGRFVTLRCLADLVKRKPETLRDQYLTVLVRNRQLSLAFPKTPSHERQAYCATSSLPT